MRNELGYLNLLKDIIENGVDSDDRTGVGTRKIFGAQLRFDLRGNIFPLITTKKIHIKSVIHELLWFIKGDTNVKYLNDNGVRIWDEWADKNGDLGPIYGKQWRDWTNPWSYDSSCSEEMCGYDQLTDVINTLKNDPTSRRMVVSTWNVSELNNMALAPCHCLFQFSVLGDELHCQLYQRSADMFLGVPFNSSSYSLLTHMIAQITGYKPGEFIHTFGDAHIYHNHFDQVNEQLKREVMSPPTISLNPNITTIDDFTYDDITINNYNPWPAIKGEVAV